jgi:hypothetical protein
MASSGQRLLGERLGHVLGAPGPEPPGQSEQADADAVEHRIGRPGRDERERSLSSASVLMDAGSVSTTWMPYGRSSSLSASVIEAKAHFDDVSGPP